MKRLFLRKNFLVILMILVASILPLSVALGAGQPPKADLDQAHNGTATSPESPVDWVNGNANEQNSHYVEGYSIPYRIVLSNLAAGDHTIVIEWDVKHSGAHAIDYITSYNRLEPHDVFDHAAENINPIEGTSATGSPDTFPIPAPSSTGSPVAGQPTADFNSLPAGERNMSLWNGTINDMDYVSEGDLNAAQSATRLTIDFTITDPGDDAVLAWGGHIGTAIVWGDGNSAGGISGSPYHSRLISLDGAGGNQDRSLSAAAVIPIPQGSITLDKVTVPSGDQQSFGFTTTGLPSPTAPSLTDAAAPIVWSELEDGTYNITENAVTGWDLTSKSCTGATAGTTITPTTNGLNIDLANGDQLICTFTNTKRAHIIVDKVTNPSSDTQSFDFTTTGTGYNGFSLTDQATPNDQSVVPGNYSVSETAVDGWTQISANCDNGQTPGTLVLTAGQTVTCTFTNGKLPKLTLVKTVINDSGGTLGIGDFPLFVDAQSVTSGTTSTLSPGNYTASETNQPGYDAGDWGDNCAADGTVTLAYGDDKTCTITNDDQQAFITVVKLVTNDNGGSAVPDDFDLTLEGDDVNSGVAVPVNPGTYTAEETQLSGYTFEGFSGDCDGNGDTTVALGESKTCTLTNNDQQSFVIVDKTVVNDNGGSAVPDDFLLTIDGGAVLDEVAVPVNPGTYTAGETNLPGYTAGAWGGDCDANAGVTVALGETKTCTITNDDQQAFITVVKVVDNDDGGSAVPDDFGLTLEGNPTTSGTAVAVNPGTYTAAETLLDGYTFDGFSGDCDVSGDTTIALGESKTCTLTNSDQPSHLIVHKVTDPASDTTTEFSITASGGTIVSPTATQPINGGGTVDYTVHPGTYDVAEAALAGWDETDNTCNDVVVGLGETEECTITNTQRGHIIVDKVTDPTGDPQSFTFTTTGAGYVSFNLTDADTPNDQQVAPGNYSVAETALTGWDLTSATCDDGSLITAIAVSPGETVTCTFTNTKRAELVIVKDAQPNDLIDFDFVSATLGNFQLDDDDGVFGGDNTLSNQSTFANLVPGDYTVAENLPNAFWTLEGVTCVVTGTSDTYGDTAAVANGIIVTLTPGARVTCTFVNTKPSPTRTQGFWQTHTTYTSNAFAAHFGGGMLIGAGGHTRLITNTQTPGASRLFGAYFSNIAKKTDNKQRSAVEKARMVLLQQLVTAKLNCAHFGCEASVQTLIMNADAAYSGTNKEAMAASTAALDAFNNSGDTLTIGPAGPATPQTSKSLANYVFWDTP